MITTKNKYNVGNEYTHRGSKKLTTDAVKWIRESYKKDTMTYKQLADIFGVTRSAIGKIIRAETWKNDSTKTNSNKQKMNTLFAPRPTVATPPTTLVDSIKTHVYATHDYSKFKPVGGNRNVNVLHAKRLLKSMKSHSLFTAIVVNENFEIVDGQHRFECIKHLNLPLHYVVCEGYGLSEVHVLNQNSKTWNSHDYATGYSDLGNPNYTTYLNFKEKYRFGHHESMVMLSGAHNSGDQNANFRKGTWKVKSLVKATLYADRILEVAKTYDGARRRSFLYAMIKLFKNPKFDFNRFMQKLSIQPSTLTDCTSTDSYIELIEYIYNYHSRDKISLRF